jgi:hypothetical protein
MPGVSNACDSSDTATASKALELLKNVVRITEDNIRSGDGNTGHVYRHEPITMIKVEADEVSSDFFDGVTIFLTS